MIAHQVEDCVVLAGIALGEDEGEGGADAADRVEDSTGCIPLAGGDTAKPTRLATSSAARRECHIRQRKAPKDQSQQAESPRGLPPSINVYRLGIRTAGVSSRSAVPPPIAPNPRLLPTVRFMRRHELHEGAVDGRVGREGEGSGGEDGREGGSQSFAPVDGCVHIIASEKRRVVVSSKQAHIRAALSTQCMNAVASMDESQS